MNYHFTHTQQNQINNMDYWSLVQTLSTQITPEYRSMILNRLVEMNNQLLSSTRNIPSDPIGLTQHRSDRTVLNNPIEPTPLRSGKSVPQPDLSRSYTQNSRKKDISELQHPSMNLAQYRGTNPLPLDLSRNFNTELEPKSSIEPKIDIDIDIDIDDIIDDLNDPLVDGLDQKLDRIKFLHTKILTDKRNKRMERERNKHT